VGWGFSSEIDETDMLKVYIECKAETEEAAREGAEQVATDLTREWFRPAETGLLVG
jgi:phosphoglucomutase